MSAGYLSGVAVGDLLGSHADELTAADAELLTRVLSRLEPAPPAVDAGGAVHPAVSHVIALRSLVATVGMPDDVVLAGHETHFLTDFRLGEPLRTTLRLHRRKPHKRGRLDTVEYRTAGPEGEIARNFQTLLIAGPVPEEER
jgi:hypothetical protein